MSGGGVPFGLSDGTLFLGRHTGLPPCQVFHFCSDLTFVMFLVMAALQSCVWEFTWYALYKKSMKHNPLISHRRQAYPGWFWNLCPEKLISCSVSLIFYSLSVDTF